MTRILLSVCAVLSVGSAICSEPVVSVTLARGVVFGSGSVIAAGMESLETFDVAGSRNSARPNSGNYGRFVWA